MVLGLEDPSHRPRETDPGTSRIYDAHGSVISLVESEVRYVHAKKHVLAVGGVTLTITKDGFAFAGGRVTHEDKNIGADHKHGGVTKGAATTDAPEG